VAALHQGAPGQLTWLEDPPPWLLPAYCFASVIAENKNVTISDRWQWNNQQRWRPVFLRLKRSSTFLRKKVHPVTWLENFLKWSGSLLRRRLNWWMTYLTTLVTWKWPGCI